jgi:hypothetical protein
MPVTCPAWCCPTLDFTTPASETTRVPTAVSGRHGKTHGHTPHRVSASSTSDTISPQAHEYVPGGENAPVGHRTSRNPRRPHRSGSKHLSMFFRSNRLKTSLRLQFTKSVRKRREKPDRSAWSRKPLGFDHGIGPVDAGLKGRPLPHIQLRFTHRWIERPVPNTTGPSPVPWLAQCGLGAVLRPIEELSSTGMIPYPSLSTCTDQPERTSFAME